VGPRADLNSVVKRKISYSGRQARNPSLYLLTYPGSTLNKRPYGIQVLRLLQEFLYGNFRAHVILERESSEFLITTAGSEIEFR
jgi:hypothetical protein